jgi:hypothetical protein
VTTQADVIGILLRRVGSVMTEVGLDGDTEGGANRSLDSAMVRAYTEMGRTPAAIDEVSDDELGALSVPVVLELVDRSEVHLLAEMATQARRLVDITVGDRSEKLSQLADGLERDAAQRRADIAVRYGSPANNVGLSFTAGRVTHSFAPEETTAS